MWRRVYRSDKCNILVYKKSMGYRVMKKRIFIWQVLGVIFTGILGIVFHFLFEWTNRNIIVALFSAVNESIWEHMKILFYPMLIFAMIESFYVEKEYEQFWNIKLIGILLGLVLIPTIYYTYTGIFGVSVDWFNIAIYFIVIIISFLTENQFFQKGGGAFLKEEKALIILGVIAIIFTVMTFIPPQIPLFEDPMTGEYGFSVFRTILSQKIRNVTIYYRV